MGLLNERASTKLSTTIVDMKTAVKVDLYTVSPGKKLIVDRVVVREPTASLAGGTDYDFGTGANADTWRQTIDLSSMTASTDYMAVQGADVTKYSVESPVAVFGVKVITGSTVAANATIDVFGYLV
jgi:hypothetical protein